MSQEPIKTTNIMRQKAIKMYRNLLLRSVKNYMISDYRASVIDLVNILRAYIYITTITIKFTLLSKLLFRDQI